MDDTTKNPHSVTDAANVAAPVMPEAEATMPMAPDMSTESTETPVVSEKAEEVAPEEAVS